MFFFHILRFCRFLSFKVCTYLYIYTHLFTHLHTLYSYMYICNYKYIYIQIPICIYFNYIYNTVHSFLGNWVLHKNSMCSFSKLPNHAAICLGRCTHTLFLHIASIHIYIYIYTCIHIIDYNFIEHIFLYYTWIYALYNFIFKYTFVALDHTIAHHISATKRSGTEGPCGDANFGSGRGLSRGQDRRVRSAGIGGIPMNHGYIGMGI